MSGENSGIRGARENFENSNITYSMQLDSNTGKGNDKVVCQLEENRELNEELLINDPKRRRIDLRNMNDKNEVGPDCTSDGFSKNGYVAGPGVQARQEP